ARPNGASGEARGKRAHTGQKPERLPVPAAAGGFDSPSHRGQRGHLTEITGFGRDLLNELLKHLPVVHRSQHRLNATEAPQGAGRVLAGRTELNVVPELLGGNPYFVERRWRVEGAGLGYRICQCLRGLADTAGDGCRGFPIDLCRHIAEPARNLLRSKLLEHGAGVLERALAPSRAPLVDACDDHRGPGLALRGFGEDLSGDVEL